MSPIHRAKSLSLFLLVLLVLVTLISIRATAGHSSESQDVSLDRSSSSFSAGYGKQQKHPLGTKPAQRQTSGVKLASLSKLDASASKSPLIKVYQTVLVLLNTALVVFPHLDLAVKALLHPTWEAFHTLLLGSVGICMFFFSLDNFLFSLKAGLPSSFTSISKAWIGKEWRKRVTARVGFRSFHVLNFQGLKLLSAIHNYYILNYVVCQVSKQAYTWLETNNTETVSSEQGLTSSNKSFIGHLAIWLWFAVVAHKVFFYFAGVFPLLTHCVLIAGSLFHFLSKVEAPFTALITLFKAYTAAVNQFFATLFSAKVEEKKDEKPATTTPNTPPTSTESAKESGKQ